jgi:hypothetical protein
MREPSDIAAFAPAILPGCYVRQQTENELAFATVGELESRKSC